MTPAMSAVSDRAIPSRQATVERWLRWFCVLLIVMATGAWLAAKVEKHELIFRPVTVTGDDGKVWHVRYGDLFEYLDKTKHPIGNGEEIFGGGPVMNYPAPAAFVYSLFANSPIGAANLFILVLCAAAVVATLLLVRKMIAAGASPATSWFFGLTLLVTSYPLWFSIDRGNIEIVLWMACMVAIWCFTERKYMTAAVLIALAGSVKPFPLCLFVLYLYRKRYKEIAVGVAVWVVTTVAGFALLGPTLVRSYEAFRYGQHVYTELIGSAYRAEVMNIDHSMMSIVKQLIRMAMGWPRPWRVNPVTDQAYLPYFIGAGLLCIVCVVILRNRPLINQVLGAMTLMIIVPPACYDYTLLYMYIPFAMLVIFLCRDYARGEATLPTKTIWELLICFAVVFTAQTFIRLSITGFGGQVKGVFLIALLWYSLFVPIPSEALDGEATPA